MPSPSVEQLRQALKITEQIEALQLKLASILGGTRAPARGNDDAQTKRRRTFSAATRAKMRAAQQARHAKPDAKSLELSTPTKAGDAPKSGKRTMSPEGRARIAAGVKARWAKIKGEQPATKPAPKSAPANKGGLTPEGRAKLAAAMKARWAARKKGAPAPNASAK